VNRLLRDARSALCAYPRPRSREQFRQQPERQPQSAKKNRDQQVRYVVRFVQVPNVHGVLLAVLTHRPPMLLHRDNLRLMTMRGRDAACQVFATEGGL